MFTGIIAKVGEVGSITPSQGGQRLTVKEVLDSPYESGESIAVNGVCLTVDAFGNDWFAADVSPETLSCTTLGALGPGGKVNLERALRPVDRLGGHFVMGHVDAVGALSGRKREGDFEVLSFNAPGEIMRYLVEKGSVAIEGVSLTVASLSTEGFTVAVIPHTLSRTTLGSMRGGEAVNLEADILGKYVEKLLGGDKPKEGLTMEKLAESGFLG